MRLLNIFSAVAALSAGVSASHEHLHANRQTTVVGAIVLNIGYFQTVSNPGLMQPLSVMLQGLQGAISLPSGVNLVTLTEGANFGFSKLSCGFFSQQGSTDANGVLQGCAGNLIATVVNGGAGIFPAAQEPACAVCALS